MPLMEIKIVPVGSRTPSVSPQIAKAVSVLKRQAGIKYRVTPMGTIVEAQSLEMLFSIARRMHAAVLASGAKRVVTFIEVDDRKDKPLSMAGKLRSLKRELK